MVRTGTVITRRVQRIECVRLGQVRCFDRPRRARHAADAVGATGPRGRGLSGRQRGGREVGRRVGCGLARLGDTRRGLRRAERVEPEDALYLRSHRVVHLRCRRVVVPGLSRCQSVLGDRRREGGLHLRHRARDGQRQAGGRWCPDGQPLPAEAGGDLGDGGRGRAVALGHLRRRQEVPVLGRAPIGDRLDLRRQRGGVTGLERHGQREGGRGWRGADQGGSRWDEALVAGELLATAPGSRRRR